MNKSHNLQLPGITKNISSQSERLERTPSGIRKASDILKNLNFHLNPSLHKKKQVKNSMVTYLPKKKSKVTRNIMELRRRKKLKSDSLDIHPRIQACKTIQGGTLSVLKNNEMSRIYLHKKYKDQIYTGSSDYTDKGKDKLRLQVVRYDLEYYCRWLIDNRKDVVSALNENKHNILEWVQCVEKVDRDEFDIMMHGINIYKDPNLINRLFWVFDLNDDGVIEYNEIQYSINLFREYDQNDKVQIFFELCDENEDGYINEEDLRRFFTKNLSNQDDLRTMKFCLKDFYNELNPRLKGLTYEDLYEASVSDSNVRIIVEKNTIILKSNNKKDDDIGASLNNLIYSGQYEGKQGVFFPQIEGLMDALAERDQLLMYHQQLKMDYETMDDHLD